jgi:hypothetical protein
LQARLHPVGIMTRRDARAAAAASLFLDALRVAATTVRADASV